MPSLIPVEHIPADHPEWILQVRARRKIDLEHLVANFIPEGQCSDIHATPGMDYNYRVYCAKETFAQAAYEIMLDIDYVKFKPQTEIRHPGPEGKLLHSVYNGIWAEVTRLGKPYVGDGTGDPYYDTLWGKPMGIAKNSQAEKVWHLLVQLDTGTLTQQEAFEQVARYPEHVWSTVATPTEAVAIRKIAQVNKAKKPSRDHRGRFVPKKRRKAKV